MELIFMEPFMKEVVWGGTKIKEEFSYKTNSDKIGEAWVVSANDNGYSTVKYGKYKGMTLKELFLKHRELFGNTKTKDFPILIKYIDAKADLSVQVHPNDEYAKKVEGEQFNGKSEAWYVLDANKDTTIEIGHTAKTKEELKEMIYNKEWNKLLTFRKVKKGDFFDIAPGTVHAIKAGTLILEVQQNSDITYRVYDYDRLQNGKLRELHIDKSIDVINCPYIETKKDVNTDENIVELVNNEYFKMVKCDIKEKTVIKNKENFVVICVLEGNGNINNIEIKKGDNLIVPYNYGDIILSGNMQLMYIVSNK